MVTVPNMDPHIRQFEVLKQSDQEVVVAFNRSERAQPFELPSGRYRLAFASVPGNVRGMLPPHSARVWIRE